MFGKKLHLISILLIFIAFLIISCQKNTNLVEFEIGNNLINNDLRISVCDTFSIQLSTVQFDSIATSNADSLLIGRLIDDRMGKLSSQCYFRVSNPSLTLLEEGDVFDSISLVVRLNGYSYGDTTKRISWTAYQLSEKLETFDDGYLYNKSSFTHFMEPLGTVSFKPYPKRKPEINIPLNKELGTTLFDMVINNDDKISSSSNFFNYFKGIVIETSNEDMNTLLGVSVGDTSILMRIYAHRDAKEREKLELDFKIETGSLPFSQIAYDRNGTLLADLKSQKNALVSTSTANESYIQGGTGVMTRVDIPGLGKALEFENMALMKAELILEPVVGTYQTSLLPTKLNFYKCDKLNRILNGYIDATTKQYVYGSLSVGTDLYNENTEYSLDITQYINDELSDNYFEQGQSGLLLYYSNPGFLVTASRLVFGDSYNKNHRAKLKLYFLHYNK